MLAERLEEWAHGYKAEGVQEGVQQGEILALQKLLTKRFGHIPTDINAKIASASREQIESWFDQAIEAGRLDDVFGPTTH